MDGYQKEKGKIIKNKKIKDGKEFSSWLMICSQHFYNKSYVASCYRLFVTGEIEK